VSGTAAVRNTELQPANQFVFGALAAIRNPAQQVAPMDDGFLN
jgi:hypothetical protein